MTIFSFLKAQETSKQKEDRIFRENQKNEFKDKINERIKAKTVSVIDREGKSLGTMKTRIAIQLAKSKGLDLIETNIDRKDPPVCKFANSDHYTLRKPPIFLSWLAGIVGFLILFCPFVILRQEISSGPIKSISFDIFTFLISLFLSFRIGLTIFTGRLHCRISRQGNVDFLLILIGFAICASLLGFIESLSIRLYIKNLLSLPIMFFTYYFLANWRNCKLTNA